MADRAELKEKVVAAIRDAWNNASNDGNPISYYLADAAIAVARPSIRAEALEEAAKMIETRWAHGTGKHQAAAIRAMIRKENSND